MEILNLVSQGLLYKEVGKALGLTERTIKYHMGEIVQQLHLRNRAEVLAYARSRGITPRLAVALPAPRVPLLDTPVSLYLSIVAPTAHCTWTVPRLSLKSIATAHMLVHIALGAIGEPRLAAFDKQNCQSLL